MQKLGIDISVWQNGFNFDKAKEEGVEFVILRGAYSTNEDKCFDDFYNQCKEKGLPVGAYHYSMAKTVKEAENEAKLMISILKGKQLEYPVYLDVEDKKQAKLGKDLLTSIVKTYCDKLEKAGYYVGIYSTYSYLNSYTHINELAKYDKWIAQWSKKCTCKIDYGMWQFGGETNMIRSNKIAGVVCDQDYCYKDYPYIIRNAGLNGFKHPQDADAVPTPVRPQPQKTVTDIAREVIEGKWGNGTERKKKITSAGYDYNAVQSKVNELLNNNKKTVDELAREVIQGKWGTGANRKRRLTQAGYDYNAVQKMVNQLI